MSTVETTGLGEFIALGRNASLMVHGVSTGDLLAMFEAGQLETVERRQHSVPDQGSYLVGKGETEDGVEVTLFTETGGNA